MRQSLSKSVSENKERSFKLKKLKRRQRMLLGSKKRRFDCVKRSRRQFKNSKGKVNIHNHKLNVSLAARVPNNAVKKALLT